MASTTALAAGADCCGETTSATTSGIEAPTVYKRRHSSFRSGKLSVSSLDWEDGLQLKVHPNLNPYGFPGT